MAVRLSRLLILQRNNNWKYFHVSSKLSNMFEYDRKAGYPYKSDYVEKPKTIFERFREGCTQLKQEFSLLKDEIIDFFHIDPMFIFRKGEVDVKWKFNGKPDVLNDWIVSCDSDFGEGRSTAKLELTPNGTGLFTGNIDIVPVMDGARRCSGYCNIKTVEPLKSFYRSTVHNWELYTHLIFRIRGDGRTYLINLHPQTVFDIMWNDLHHYTLYTRGGPYWQYVKIPFSKFFLSSRGRVQDHQAPVRKNCITAISITATGGIPGPFSLEIDFIGVECDRSFDEKYAYETYHAPFDYYK